MPSNNNMIATGGPNVDTIAARRPQTATNFPLPQADLESLGFRHQQIDRIAADDGKKTKKKKKNVFLGYRTRKGITRSGKGKNAVIETFNYLREYKEPSAYAPAKYYYNVNINEA